MPPGDLLAKQHITYLNKQESANQRYQDYMKQQNDTFHHYQTQQEENRKREEQEKKARDQIRREAENRQTQNYIDSLNGDLVSFENK